MGGEASAWEDRGTSGNIVGACMRPGEDGRSYGDESPCTQAEIACSEGLRCREYLVVDEGWAAWVAAHGA